MTRRGIERHGTGASWFQKNAMALAAVTGFGIALGISYGVIRWL